MYRSRQSEWLGDETGIVGFYAILTSIPVKNALEGKEKERDERKYKIIGINGPSKKQMRGRVNDNEKKKLRGNSTIRRGYDSSRTDDDEGCVCLKCLQP